MKLLKISPLVYQQLVDQHLEILYNYLEIDVMVVCFIGHQNCHVLDYQPQNETAIAFDYAKQKKKNIINVFNKTYK